MVEVRWQIRQVVKTALHNENVFAAIVERKLTAIRNDTACGAFVLGKQSRRKIHAFEPHEPEAVQRDQAIPAAAKKFHNLGIGADTRGNLNDLGRYAVTNVETDKGCFKTPSLRNLAHRGPYMHDGSFPTVKEAFAHYIGGGNWNPYLDKEIHSLDLLTFDERDDLLEFLDSLNGKLPDNIGPPPDPAGLSKATSAAK